MNDAAAARTARAPSPIDVALLPIQWEFLEGREPPARQWLIDHWWGKGHVTLLASLGGIGKTMVAQATATAVALGLPYLAPAGAPRRILFWVCEDDHIEIWRRQLAICRHFGVSVSDLKDRLYLVPRAGFDNTLMSFEYGHLLPTPLLHQLAEQIADLKVDGVILDNAANVFAGEENNRHQVTRFGQELLGNSNGAGVLLLAHTAKAQGSEFSGSTGWENVSRMRLWLTRALPDQQTGDIAPSVGDENTIFLLKRKANYSAKDYRTLTYRNGLFVCEDAAPSDGSDTNNRALREKQAERIVLNAITRATAVNHVVSDSPNASNYVGKFARDAKLIEPGVTMTHLRQAVARLEADGHIEMAKIGVNASRHPRLGLRVRPPS